MDEAEASVLKRAAALHDVGKIGVPDAVLRKAGPLDDEEWELMKQHTVIGAGILAGSRSHIVQMAEEIARTHHEHWDGSGYPEGLRGEEIPLVGRICAICDVFDALTSTRPYKPSWDVDEALVGDREPGRPAVRSRSRRVLHAPGPELRREHAARARSARAPAAGRGSPS